MFRGSRSGEVRPRHAGVKWGPGRESRRPPPLMARRSQTLRALEALELEVRRSGTDTKWRELASLLGEVFTVGGLVSRIAEPDVPYGAGEIPQPPPSPRQKLVVFTEHRDTLSYLHDRITSLQGREESVVTIHGSVGREDRLKAREAFRHDPQVQVLLATDAAGEGINLQRAHLMVNYDLPWNPNRLEQRFGRIHRIGQTEVCHLWNLVADKTREGDVYRKLLEKLEQARKSLGGQVFDVLGKLHFEGRPLRELMVEAIRYGEQPEVRARLDTAIDHALDRGRLQDLLEERALAHDAMDSSRVQRIRENMVRAEARRLQPALRRVVLPRGVPATGRHREAARGAALRDYPRSGAGSESGPIARYWRAGAASLRAHRVREIAGRAAGPAPGGVRVSRAPIARCDFRAASRSRSIRAGKRRGAAVRGTRRRCRAFVLGRTAIHSHCRPETGNPPVVAGMNEPIASRRGVESVAGRMETGFAATLWHLRNPGFVDDSSAQRIKAERQRH